MYNQAHNKMHDKPDQVWSTWEGKQYGTVQPCGLGTTATNQAAPLGVIIGHNAAADTSPRQAKVNPENDSNLHEEE